MYAVIDNGGQQHRVAPGDVIRIQKVAAEGSITIDKVMLVSRDEKVFVGDPYLKNASVTAEVQGDVKGNKVLIFKKKPRKGHQKLNGHRQQFTVVKIKDIVFGG